MTTARETADRIARNVHLVRSSPYIPFEPTDLQWAFLCDDRPEILMGGGTGGGKSFGLLAAALMYAHIPGYSAMIFRKTYPDLMMPSGLIPLAASWLTNTDAHKHDGGKKWTFPSGATLTFAHLENPQDRFKYAGSESQFTGWDEIAQMEQESYEFLKTRQRRSTTTNPDLAEVPMRIRATANPGHKHSLWVKEYFISNSEGKRVANPDRLYIASTLDDNPHLDRADYAARLEMLGPVEREQARRGNWDILPLGNLFQEESFLKVPGRMTEPAHRIRMWDLAGSAKKKSDYCAGVLMARSKSSGIYRVEHVIHEKLEPGPLDRKMKQTAELDGKAVHVGIEEEKSGSGKLVSAHFRKLLRGFIVRPMRPTGDKVERAGLASSLVDHGLVEVTIAPWNEKFISECVGFPEGANDDMLDAFAYGCHHLSRLPVQNLAGSNTSAIGDGSRTPTAREGDGSREATARGKPRDNFAWLVSQQGQRVAGTGRQGPRRIGPSK